MDEMSISHTQAGAAFSVCILALMALRIPWGILIDRIGFAKSMKAAMVLISVFGVLRSFSTSYEMLLTFQFFLGVGLAAVLPCLSKLVSVWAADKAGSATGVYVVGFPAGEAAAFTLTAYMLLLFESWRFPFLIFGVWSCMLLFLWVILGREPPRSRLETRGRFKTGFKELIRIREIWVLTGLCILGMGAYDTLLAWLPKILELRGFQLEAAGPLASALPLGFLAAGLSVGLVSDKGPSKKVLLIALGAVGGLITPFISLSFGLPLGLSIFSFGFCTTGIVTLILILPVQLPETREKVGSAVGFISAIGNLGPFSFPILLGYIVDVTDSVFSALLMLSVIIGASAILSLNLNDRDLRAFK